MTRHVEDQEIRQYLLGRLAEQDEIALEAAYFGDPALLDRIDAVAGDLADEYVSGRMPADERMRFEGRLLASEEGREDAAFARALHAVQRRAARSADARATRALPAWLGWAAAIAVIAGGGYAGWLAWSWADRAAPGTPPVADAPPSAPAPPAAPSTPEAVPIRVARLVLTSDLARSEGQPPTLAGAADITHVDLLLPSSEPARAGERARITSVEGTLIWSGTIEGPDRPDDQRARVRAPAESLAPGDYILSLPDGAAYYFRVRNSR